MNKIITRLLAVFLCLSVVFCGQMPVFAQTSSPDGSVIQEQPITRTITISTPKEFVRFSEDCRLNSYSFGLGVQLTADIDLTGSDFDCIPSFSGVFDGGGHTISGLSLTTDGSVQGLFRYLRVTAVVRDLTVEGEITPGGSHSSVGGLAGRNAGRIENCRFSGQVSGSEKVGGLVGLNELTGLIDGCTAAGDIHGDHFVGGVAGENCGVVRDSVNLASVNATASQNNVDIADITLDSITGSEFIGTATDIGGVAGHNSGVIRGSENQGTIGYPRIGYNVGGIAGSQIGYITGCTNSGDVYGRKEVGGIVGQFEPGTMLRYEEDALQTLHGQLEDMSAIMNGASAVVQNGSEQFSNQAGELQGQIDGALDAMGQLVPDGSGDPMDPDSTLAALNNLSGAMSSINSTVSGMAATGQESVSALTDRLGALMDQIYSIGTTIDGAVENVGGTVIDVSDQDSQQDVTAKVESCVNTGTVSADINVGGIAGAMAVENDLDMEDDFDSTGNVSMNADCEVRAVILNCRNSGTVRAARQNAGGIVGWMTLGLLRECASTGEVEAEAAKYIGGITGQSSGYIRSCAAKCLLEGAAYVGGISGSTDGTVTDCRSMVRIDGASEKIGSVFGYSEKLADGRDDLPVTNNFYFAIDRDIGGVDGISYDGAAQPLSRDEFFALDGLPDIFDSVTVRFVFEDETARTYHLEPGTAMDVGLIPAIPEKPGYIGCWEGLEQLNLSMIVFDTELNVVYEPLDSALQSRETGEDGLPLLLALGEFSPGEALNVISLTAAPLEDGMELIDCREFSLSGSGTITQLRFRLPQDADADEIRISVRDTQGDWVTRSFSADGSYIVFPVEEGESAFRLDSVPQNYLMEYAVAGGAALLMLIIVVGVILSRRKKCVRVQENAENKE